MICSPFLGARLLVRRNARGQEAASVICVPTFCILFRHLPFLAELGPYLFMYSPRDGRWSVEMNCRLQVVRLFPCFAFLFVRQGM